MESKKIYLEQLFEEIRSLTEQFSTDELNEDVIVLKPNEVAFFSEELMKVVTEFMNNEMLEEDYEDFAGDDADDTDMMFLEDDDDDELE